ncbi:MAG TPA: hypothetical protein DDW52_19960 [Planctomycetaceae bacterium]|nr:hypothetical protein [Planctomycetaceae bacterium]
MPEGTQIKVCCNSGANIKSTHEHYVEPVDLGFDDRAAWDAATEEEKMEAVTEYWNSQGYPEIYWED